MNARFAKPLDESCILSLAEGKSLVLTVEEGALTGGFGSAVLELFERTASRERSALPQVRTLGLPDRFIEHGKRELVLDSLGLSAPKIKSEVLRLLSTGQYASLHG